MSRLLYPLYAIAALVLLIFTVIPLIAPRRWENLQGDS